MLANTSIVRYSVRTLATKKRTYAKTQLKYVYKNLHIFIWQFAKLTPEEAKLQKGGPAVVCRKPRQYFLVFLRLLEIFI